MKDWQEKRRWVTGGIPANINWGLLLSPEIQKLLPDKKRNAVRLYWKHSKLKLKDAENAIDYAILYPDRVAAEAARVGVAPQKNKPKAGINWDVLHSPEIQALLPEQRLEAIKLYSEQTGADMKEAADAIAKHMDNQRIEQKG